jgi:hypothetical protein
MGARIRKAGKSFRGKGGFAPRFDLKKNSNVNLYIKEFKGKNEMEIEILTKEEIMEIEILTADELMEILPLNELALTLLVKQKQIPHFYIGKRNLRFRTEEIIDWFCNLKKQAGVA